MVQHFPGRQPCRQQNARTTVTKEAHLQGFTQSEFISFYETLMQVMDRIYFLSHSEAYEGSNFGGNLSNRVRRLKFSTSIPKQYKSDSYDYRMSRNPEVSMVSNILEGCPTQALKIKKSNPFLILRREGDGVIPHGLTINNSSPIFYLVPLGDHVRPWRPFYLLLSVILVLLC